MSTAAVPVIDKNRKQPKYPARDEPSKIKRNGQRVDTTIWMDLGDVSLSGGSQSQRSLPL